MKELKNHRGITLIALIITIIVLLILAGVSISMVVGENGILNRATDSSQKTREAEARDKISMEIMGSYDGSGSLNLEDLNNNLMNNLDGVQIKNGGNYADLSSSNKIESLPVTVKYNGYEVDISENGEVEILQKRLPAVSIDNPKVELGDVKVNDTILPNGWKYFCTENNRIILIYEDYFPANLLTINGETVKTNGEYCVSSTIGGYDLLNFLIGETDNYKNSWNELKAGVKSALISNGIKEDNLSDMKVFGAPTAEQLEKAYNERYPSDNFKVKYFDVETNSDNDNLIFPYHSVQNGCGGYWIASLSAQNENFVDIVARDMFTANYCSITDIGLRPIISLPSKIFSK